MKKINIQIFIILIGILLCIAGVRGVKKYFYDTYKFDKEETIVVNDLADNVYVANYIEEDSVVSEEDLKIESMTTTVPTTSVQTTTIKPYEDNNNIVSSVPTYSDNGEIIYDNLTFTELVNKLDKNLNSTLSNTGYYFANYYKKTGLDPYLAVAIVLQETGCKWTCSTLVQKCNNIGGLRGGSCSGNFKSYNTLEEGINGYLDILYNNYYSQGLTTAELMNPKYASSTEWSVKVNKYIEQIRAS